jgi:tetratricopeptide (TPR) repeat protein
MEHFLTSVAGSDLVFRAACRPQTSKPYYPVYEAVAEHIAKRPWRSDRLIGVIREYAALVPYIGAWLTPLMPDPASAVRAAPPRDIFADRSHAPHLLEFIRRLSQKRPAIFWIDSVQWADQETLEYLQYLRDHAGQGNLLWILTINPRGHGIQIPVVVEKFLAYYRSSAREYVHIHELLPYPRTHFEDLLTQVLGAPVSLDPGSMDLLYEKTRGVPYIVKTVAELLRDQGRLVKQGGTYSPKEPLRDLSLPTSLRSAIEERVRASYSAVPNARGILEAAAVIGERFEDATLDAVLDLCDTYTLLAAIEDKHHLVRSLIEERRWEFEHVTIRDFIYTSLGRAASRIHRRLAEHLVADDSEDQSQIAYHFRQAGDHRSCILYTLRHARQCLRHGFFGEARRVFDELWEAPEFFSDPEYSADGFSIHYDRMLAYFYCGQYARCLDLLREIPDPPGATEEMLVQLLRAKCLNKSNWRGDFSRAADVLEVISRRPAERSLSGSILAELVVAYAHLNRFEDARLAFVAAERLLNTNSQFLERAQLMRKSCIFYEAELSIPILRQAAGLARSHRVEHEAVRALNNLASVYILQGDFASAGQVLDEALEISDRLGGFGRDYLLNNSAIIKLRNGAPEHAAATFAQAMECTARPVIHLILQNNQAACRLALGAAGDAVGVLERLLEEATMVGEDVYMGPIRLNLAVAYGALGRYTAAFAELARCQQHPGLVEGGFASQKNRVLLRLLTSAGALKTDVVRESGASAYPHVTVIDMQFWGD